MAFDVWPASLPQQVLVQGYQGGMGDGRKRTRTDIGPGLNRRRSSAMADPLRVMLPPIDSTQLAALKNFVDVTLADGSLPFMMPDPENDGQTVLVRFANSLPSWVPADSLWWTVTLDLEKLP